MQALRWGHLSLQNPEIQELQHVQWYTERTVHPYNGDEWNRDLDPGG